MLRIRRAVLLGLASALLAACGLDPNENPIGPVADSGGTITPGDQDALPTGPPPEMAWPDASRDGSTMGSSDAGAGPGPTPTNDAGGAGPGPTPTNDAGGATGGTQDGGGAASDAGASDAFVPDPVDGGPLNMAPVKFGRNVKVNDDTGRAQQTEVVMAAHPNGLLFAGWVDNRQSPSRCAYSISKDGGQTWSKNIFAATQGSGNAFAGDPAVAIDDMGTLYAGCQDYASGGLGTNYILLAHSKDGGASFSPFKRIHQSLDKPWLGATGNGTVLVTWLGNPGGMKRSTDFGETWATPISLGYINHGTTATFAKGLVHVAYNTGETTVTYRRSTDNGVTFEPAKNISAQGQPCRSPCSPRSHPIVGADSDPTGQVVAVTWASRLTHEDAEGDDDVWLIVSLDAGKTFSKPMRVNDNPSPSRQFQSWVAVDSYGAVHVVWTDMRNNGNNDTYYARMTDLAMGFEANVKINESAGRASGFLGDYKGIDIQGRDVVVTWTDTRTDSGDIYFARAKDAAAAGGPLLR